MRTPLHLRPVRSLALLTALGAVVASGCGVTADTTAATLGDRTVSIEQLDEVIAEPAIVGPDQPGVTESRQPGDLARAALMYELQRLAWIEEAERWGVEPTDAERSDAEQQLDMQLQQAGVQLSSDIREGAIESTAAQNALLTRWAEIDPGDDADLRLIYDGAPSRWRSWCLTVVAVNPDTADRVESLLDDGVALDRIPERVDQAELLATPEDCFVGSELPVELETAAREVTGGERPEPVASNLGGAGEGLLFFDVERSTSSSFDEAREEVAFVAESLSTAVQQLGALSTLGVDATEQEIQQAQQQAQTAATVLRGWVDDRLRAAEINPRYGSGVVARSEQLGGGLEVAPPPAPLQRSTDLLGLPDGVAVDPAATAGG